MTEQAKSFWTSLPGVLTGVAAIITAVTGLYIAIGSNLGGDGTTAEAGTSIVIEESVTDNHSSGTGTHALTDQQIIDIEAKARVKYDTLPQTSLKPLVDCKLFPTVNTTASLMSWSNYYHKKITKKPSQGDITDACNKAIDYRGMAHCKEPNNLDIRQGLNETLTLCKAAGIEWMDIQHSHISLP